MAEHHDRWAAGSTYEDFMGRWSRKLAPRFVAWLGIPAEQHWLDVGCGTGALTRAICENSRPASVLACDPAAPFIEYARKHVSDERVSFVVAGVGGLPARPDGYGGIASLFAMNFFPDAGAAVEEMRSLATPGATVSACVWDYADGMGFLRRFWDAVVALDPAACARDEGARFPLCKPDALEDVFRNGGLDGVRCEPIEITTEFADFDDYWRPFLGGTGPAPSYVASLDEDARAALANALEKSLPRSAQGRIALSARAWAVRGTAER
ncbi:MAG: class I SAM-dependent methyltransferase [Candidatus Krumholzibacteria bacterium]|nr:class I SAM-dependent methyltransferase [Candidatus Krumholzibacteria bacterium]MDH4336904.1 class I SAM-dependent methyltransferase [Candidatus Krumholzibacteria bacterium]MDH5269800.1 class I SAM-dependent methyltransferase [Candidatus Krumholzibacteria bacterium]